MSAAEGPEREAAEDADEDDLEDDEDELAEVRAELDDAAAGRRLDVDADADAGKDAAAMDELAAACDCITLAWPAVAAPVPLPYADGAGCDRIAAAEEIRACEEDSELLPDGRDAGARADAAGAGTMPTFTGILPPPVALDFPCNASPPTLAEKVDELSAARLGAVNGATGRTPGRGGGGGGECEGGERVGLRPLAPA
jgi:hypothetical protein